LTLNPKKSKSAINNYRFKNASTTKFEPVKETASEEDVLSTRRVQEKMNDKKEEKKKLPEHKKKMIEQETRMNCELTFKKIIIDN
jgi:ABC-type Fe3+-citrate transport system substrate-binding protein